MTRWMIALEGLAVFALTLAFFAFLTLPEAGLIGQDGYYHFKIAQQILDHGPWVDIRWLPYTVLGEHGPDHHWLWHLLIAPFALIPNPEMAIKWATIATAALVPATLSVVGRLLRIPYAPLFALLAVCAGHLMPGRLLMLRAQDIAIVFMALAFAALAHRRLAALGLITFLFVESYHGAVILGAFFIAFAVIGYLRERERPLPLFISMAGGGLLGLLLSPWFPRNIEYLLFHTLFKFAHGNPELVGTEWYKMSWGALLTDAWPTHLLLGAALAVTLVTGAKGKGRGLLATDTWAALLLTTLFLAMYHASWRFAEYYIPFGCLTAGLLLRDSGIMTHASHRARAAAALPIAALLLFLGQGTPARIAQIERVSADDYREIGAYLQTHAHPGEMVFNSHWPDFVPLFLHADKVRYVSGLDGHYLLYGSPEKFKTWDDIHNLRLPPGTDVGEVIAHTFAARWAVIPRGHEPIAHALSLSPRTTLVLETPAGWLFRLREP